MLYQWIWSGSRQGTEALPSTQEGFEVIESDLNTTLYSSQDELSLQHFLSQLVLRLESSKTYTGCNSERTKILTGPSDITVALQLLHYAAVVVFYRLHGFSKCLPIHSEFRLPLRYYVPTASDQEQSHRFCLLKVRSAHPYQRAQSLLGFVTSIPGRAPTHRGKPSFEAG